jgi:hypothetical protein
VARGISRNIFKTQGSVYKKCGLRLNYGQVHGVIYKVVGICWFQNYFTIGNDVGRGPRFMDRWRLGPPWTTRRHRLEATGVRRHAHRSLASSCSRARKLVGDDRTREGRTAKPARRSPKLERRRDGQVMMANQRR